MHPKLLKSLKQFEEHFKQDPRCLKMFLHGSIGRKTTDEYSDVDVSIVVKDEDYADIRRELRPLCEKICGPIVVWLPEGESDGYCNHAFLFEYENSILLYDFETIKEQYFIKNGAHEDTLLFSRMANAPVLHSKQAANFFSPATLALTIDNFLVYAYLCGKYSRRNDLFKLLYVQQVLFQTHLKVLNHLHPDYEWVWWAGEANKLSPEKQKQLLMYFSAATINDIRNVLAEEISGFSRDAIDACQKYKLSYPEHTESAVRRHLRDMGCV